MEKKDQITPVGSKERLEKKVSKPGFSNDNDENILTDKKKSKAYLIKILIFSIGGFLILIFTIILLLYYKSNLSPGAILEKALYNLNSKKNFKYNGSIKLTFSSGDSREDLDLNEIEIYSLIKKSNSDNHEISIQGEVNRESDVPSGNFNLSWSISKEKAFAFDGKFIGYDILYRAQSYPYSGLISEKSADEYSPLNLKDFLKRIYFDVSQSDLPDMRLDSFKYEFIESLPDDLINGQKAYHYKIKFSPKEEISNIFSNVELEDCDVWIGKKSREILRIEGVALILNAGMEGNSMNVQFDIRLNWE